MHLKLAKTLIEKNAIAPSSELECVYKTKDLGGDLLSTSRDIFSIVRVFIHEDSVLFEGRSTRDGTFRKMSFSDVLRIDGMEPERLAFVYNVDDEGEPLKAGNRRRGRKPKRRDWEDVDF